MTLLAFNKQPAGRCSNPIGGFEQIRNGKGARRRRQEPCIHRHKPQGLAFGTLSYRLNDALQAMDAGATRKCWGAGDSCIDACWSVGLPAINSLGSSHQFRPEPDGAHIPDQRLVVCPSRDKPGFAYSRDVAQAQPKSRALITVPDHPSCPTDAGRDDAG